MKDDAKEVNSLNTINYAINLLNTLFENLPIPMVLVDKEAKIRYFNKAYASFLHIEEEREKVIGRHIREIISNSRVPIVMETRVPEIDSTHRFPDGRTAIGSRIPIIDNNQVIGAVGYILFESAQELKKLANKYQKLEEEILRYREILDNRSFAKYTFLDIVGHSQIIQDAKQTAMRYATIDLPVLVLGESGVGKELFVHAIHDSSRRKYGPLIRVNCGAIPQDLFEAEFFGYESGAFTGAKKEGKKGFFELADHGTLFLDEIADLPLFMQTKLLRVIQEKEFLKVGGEKYQSCDVRIIGATNIDIRERIKTGSFREDLFYRLNTLILEVPSLRQRKEDIPTLMKHLLAAFCQENSLPSKSISPESRKRLLKYEWPGNIRELKNVMERAAVMSRGDRIELHDVQSLLVTGGSAEGAPSLPLKQYLQEKEESRIMKVLQECGGNKTKAARILGIHRSLLYKKYANLLGEQK